MNLKPTKIQLFEQDFEEYNQFRFEKSDPATFFSRVNCKGYFKHKSQEYINSHSWRNLDSISLKDERLVLEYLFGEDNFSMKTHLVYFETPIHKLFISSGLDNFIDNVYIEDKTIELARNRLREKDIFGSAGDFLMGANYKFDFKGDLSGLADFIKTVLKIDLKM